MRIYKRGETYWAQYLGRRFSLKTSDRKAAEIAFKAHQRREADPANTAADETTIAERVEKLLATKETNRSAGTRHMYGVKAGHVLRVFGADAPMSAITPGAVDAYVLQRQQEGASNSTIGKELTTIVQLCKAAKRAGVWAGDLSTLKPADFRIDYKPREGVLTAADEAKLRGVCTAEQWGAVAFILGTGCRLSELLAAQPGDIDFKRREVRIRGTKTPGSYAVIPILKSTTRYLKLAAPHVPFTWTRMSKGLPELCAAAGLPHLTPNDLRRTVSTRLIEAGADPYDVAKITRHATLTMLKRVYDRAQVAATRARIDARDGTKTVHMRVRRAPNKPEKRSEP